MNDEAQNTDRELWREIDPTGNANSIHVTDGGGIGINVGGHVIVMPLAKWHQMAIQHETFRYALMNMRAKISEVLLIAGTTKDER